MLGQRGVPRGGAADRPPVADPRRGGHHVCVAFPALSAIDVTDASGTFNEPVRHAAWARMAAAGVQLMNWFSLACELHRDWRNDIEGLGSADHIPAYRNMMTSYNARQK